MNSGRAVKCQLLTSLPFPTKCLWRVGTQDRPRNGGQEGESFCLPSSSVNTTKIGNALNPAMCHIVISWVAFCSQPIARKKVPQYWIGLCWKWTIASRKGNHHLSTWRLIFVPSTMRDCMRNNGILILCTLTFGTSDRKQEDNAILMLRSTYEMLLTLG